jgi:16S rRNA processing protein RimM
MASAEWLEVGRIGAPFGVKGWVHVESFTDPPEQLLSYRRWNLRRGSDEPTKREMLEGREHVRGVIVRLEGIEDRDAAALLQGCNVLVARGEMPPLKERQYFQADLMGLEVTNLQGARLGVVAYFAPTPAGMTMVVSRPQGNHWIPATPQFLRKVDLDAGKVLVDWSAELA